MRVQSVVSMPRRCICFRQRLRSLRRFSLAARSRRPVASSSLSHIVSYSLRVISRSEVVRPSVNWLTTPALKSSPSSLVANL